MTVPVTRLATQLETVEASLAELQARRDRLRAELAERLGLGPAPSQPQAWPTPLPVSKYQPGRHVGNGMRTAQVLELARNGIVTPQAVMRVSKLGDRTAKGLLRKLVRRGQLECIGLHRYIAKGGKQAPAPRAAKATGSRQGQAPKGKRPAEALAMAREKGRVTIPMVAAALGIKGNYAGVLLALLTKRKLLRREDAGVYALADSPQAGQGNSNALVALAVARDGLINASAVYAAGLAVSKGNAEEMLRALVRRGRLVRVEAGEYATPNKAAEAREEKRAARAPKPAEETAP